MHVLNDISRRLFLRQADVYSAFLGGAAPLALNLAGLGAAAARTWGAAAAQAAGGSGGDHRALVCVFLYGGNDAFNTVLQTDRSSLRAHLAARGQEPESIALAPAGVAPNPAAPAGSPARLGGVLVLNPGSVSRTASLTVHPLLTALPPLFDAGRLAVLAQHRPTVGPHQQGPVRQPAAPAASAPAQPHQPAEHLAGPGPRRQRPRLARASADQVAALNGQPVFTAVSAAGNAVWLAGNEAPVPGGLAGAIRLGINEKGQIFDSATVGAALQRLVLLARSSHPLDADVAAVGARSIIAEQALRTALRPASDPAFGTSPNGGSYQPQADPKMMFPNPLTGSPAYNPLAGQLQMVARLVDAGLRGASGVRRQVFFVSLGGFDTHSLQNSQQALLMARLSQGLAYFDTALAALGALGAQSQVTTFTASDFGRSLTSNGDGTDHGWGGHQFVMGAAVRGGRSHGTMPVPSSRSPNNNECDASPELLANGALLPGTSVDQLGCTLGRWFGASDAALLNIFPSLANFNASVHDLRVMNA